jgi:glycerol-3-phosphate O-acyltransferase
MAKTIVLPLWLVVCAGLALAWAFVAGVLIPGIRLFFKRREEIFVQKIRKRLNLTLPAFKLIKKQVIVDRLLTDPHVLRAADEYAAERKIPVEAALKAAQAYAREIVPSFHAYAYYLLGTFVGASLARLIYRVRVGYADEEGLSRILPQSSLVFLMNHRSNMDYIILGYLTMNRAALSFAVGEWARAWPVKPLVKAMGAYFVRRRSGDSLYRRVLARYVQMAAEGGLIQAVFPEGRLSRSGSLTEPRTGLLDYMLRGFDPAGARDLVFIPAGINYDRIFEDRTLLLEEKQGAKKAPLKALVTTLSFIFRNFRLMLTGGWHRFGYAAVYFGTPFSTRDYLRTRSLDFRSLGPDERHREVERLGRILFDEVGRVVPVLPVSVLSTIFINEPDTGLEDRVIKARAFELMTQLEAAGASLYVPRKDKDYFVRVGLRTLVLRHFVIREGTGYRANKAELSILHFYANSISHLIPIR